MSFILENRKILYVWFGFVFIASSTVFFLFSQNGIVPSFQPSPLGECSILHYSGEGKIDMVFFADEETTSFYAGELLMSPPFDDHFDDFNIFYIDDYIPDCDLYSGKALLCATDKKMIREAARCPNDFIVAFETHPLSIRSSSYLNIMSINRNHPPREVFLHEFGHALANMAEEYESSGKIPKGAKNCQSSCDSFVDSMSCFEGCTSSSYHRSIFNGVMRSLSTAEYGENNERIIKKRIAEELADSQSFITGSAVDSQTSCEEQEYILVTVNEDRSAVISQEYLVGCGGTLGYGDSELTVLSNGEVVVSEAFNSDYFFTAAPDPQTLHLSGEVIPDPSFVTIFKIPIVQENKPDEIRIIDADGNEIVEIIEEEGSYACNVDTV